MAAEGALGGLRVLDASESIAGQFCCRMLADYGAEVILLEPPEGSAVRRRGPFRDAGGRNSLLFFHNNTGKSSVTLDWASGSGRALLGALAATANAVVADARFDAATVRAANPGCVIATVSPFGADGPLKDWRGTEMIHQALAGIMKRNGEAGREPLYGCGDRASYGAGVAAYISVLAALYSGTGQDVAVDIAETTASMANPFVTQYLYNGIEEPRGRPMPFARVRCRDGWVGIYVHAHLWRALCEAIGMPGLADDPRFAQPKTRLENWGAFVELVQARTADWPADDLLVPLQARKVVAARAYSLTELRQACPHLDARGYWESVDGHTVLGPQFRMSATPRRARAAAPEIGEANARIYGELGLSAAEIAALRTSGVI